MVLIVLASVIFMLLLIIITMLTFGVKLTKGNVETITSLVDFYEDALMEKELMLNEKEKDHQSQLKKHYERLIVLDSHHVSEKRVMLFLMLEQQGMKLPQNQMQKLRQDFVEEGILKDDFVSKMENEMRAKAMGGNL